MSNLTKTDHNVRLILLLIAVGISLALILTGCNPVKRVLKDPFKTQQVFDEGVKLGWCVNDSVYVSDTTILLDTLHVIESTTDTLKVDSVVYITKTDYKTITKTVTIRDTTVVTDNSRISLLQKQLIKKDGEYVQKLHELNVSQAETKQAREDRNKWRLWFFLLLGAFVFYLFRKPLRFAINRVSPIKL